MSYDVFISYSSKDKPTADATCAVLEQNSVRCWIAPRDLLPGMSWGSSVIDAINGARLMVLVFSEHANKSPQVEREIERAVNRSIPIIPMRIENVLSTKSLEYFISTPHWLDAFTPPLEKHLNRLTEIVRYNLPAQSGSPISPNSRANAIGRQGDGAEEAISSGREVPHAGAGPGRSREDGAAAGKNQDRIIAKTMRSPISLLFIPFLILVGLVWFLHQPAPQPHQPTAQTPAQAKVAVRSIAPVSCDEEGNLRSQVTQMTTISFWNRGKNPKRVYWLDYTGKRQSREELKQNQSLTHYTDIGHPWLVADNTDKCEAIYIPTANPQVVELNDQ